MMRMPEHGRSRDEVFHLLEDYGTQDLPWREGGTFAYVYTTDEGMEEVIKHAYMRYLTENGLDPTVYPSLLRFEKELVSMAAAHLNGDSEVVGNFTSGGTESCMLAVKAARDMARANRPGVTRPELVIPVTGHAAFHKACHYFDVTPVLVPVDPDTLKVSASDMEAAVTDQTVLLVASAPQYAHGVIDPIADIGQVALSKDLPFHVDGCVGAFMLPFFRMLGRPVPDFDFSVPGVTSISMDFHKYAYAAKGASIILYKNKGLRRHQIYACAEWTGYTVINNTIQSSKSGGPLAACWALLNYMGQDGYLRLARRTAEGMDRVMAGLKTIPGLRVMGEPDFSLVAFTADEFSVFPIVDDMKSRGWYVQPQLAFGEHKENIHLTIDQATVDVADRFLTDLSASTQWARGLGPMEGIDDLVAFARSLTPETLTPEIFEGMMSASGVEGSALPEGTAFINEVLNAVPPPLRTKILTEFFNVLFVPAQDGPNGSGGAT